MSSRAIGTAAGVDEEVFEVRIRVNGARLSPDERRNLMLAVGTAVHARLANKLWFLGSEIGRAGDR